jgi:hypothetical protein
MVGDDFVYRTPGWDIAIRDEFQKKSDRIVFVFGEDGIQHGHIGTHGFVHKAWTDTLGYYAPMQFAAYCHDHWLDDIAARIGRKVYRGDLLFEHVHPAAKKAPMDEGYQRMLSHLNSDLVLWGQLADTRAAEAQKLLDRIQTGGQA